MVDSTILLSLGSFKPKFIMKYIFIKLSLAALMVGFLSACGGGDATNTPKDDTTSEEVMAEEVEFQYMTEQFSDFKIIRYQIPAWDELSLDNKKLSYYLTQAGLSGRDMMYDQNYRHNLEIRRVLETIYTTYPGDKTSEDWKAFEVYSRLVLQVRLRGV